MGSINLKKFKGLKMKIRATTSRFLNENSGNIAMITAVVMPVLFMVIGSAVSVNDLNNRKSRLQSHADIMSLEMAKKRAEFETKDARLYFRKYMATEMKKDEDCKFALRYNPPRATVTCNGELETFLAGFMNKKNVPYTVVSEATMNTSNIFEVAFVFDISDSMIGQEIEDLKAGLVTITESELFSSKESRLSLIPFANTVRLGSELEKFVTPGSGYDDADGVYNGCFDRDMTDPDVNLSSNQSFSLVVNALNSGRGVCPPEAMTAVFHQEATDWLIKDMASNIETSFGTGMSDALVWGFRSLDPSLSGVISSASQYPLAVGLSSKNIIMMTDGRPYDRPWSGPGGGAVTQQLSLDRFREVCASLPLEANDINFHLINYNNNNLSDEHLEVFNGCVRGEGEFHNVAAGNLSTVLDKITNEISSLRLSK